MNTKKVLTLALIASALLFSSCKDIEAATYYVSNTSGNGYSVGSDANTTGQAQSKSTPWLTIAGAESKASTGDIIYVNYGSYAESGSVSGVVLAKGITWISDGGYSLITAPFASGGGVVALDGTTTALLSGFIFDATVPTRCIYLHTTVSNKTITNCKFINATTYYISPRSGTSNLTLDGCYFDGFTTGGYAITNASPSLSITNCIFGSSTPVSTSLLQDTKASGELIFTGNEINLNIASGSYPAFITNGSGTTTLANNIWNATACYRGIAGTYSSSATGSIAIARDIFNITANNYINDIIDFSSGTNNINISGIQMSVPGKTGKKAVNIYNQGGTVSFLGNSIVSSTQASGTDFILLALTSNGASYSSATISNNTFISSATQSTGNYIVRIGDDSYVSASAHKIEGGIFTGNTIIAPIDSSSGVHNVLIGMNNNWTIAYNKIVGGGYPLVIKGSGQGSGSVWTSGYVAYNLMRDGSYYYHIKGSSGIKTYNNVITGMNTGGVNIIAYDSQNSTNCIFKNNIISQGIGNYGISIDSGSATGFECDYNTNYLYGTATVYAIASGVSYTNWDTWKLTGYDAHSLNSDPEFASATDFHLRSSSPCINAGTTIEGLTTDFDGRKVPYSVAPDIGAYEYRPTVGPFRW